MKTLAWLACVGTLCTGVTGCDLKADLSASPFRVSDAGMGMSERDADAPDDKGSAAAGGGKDGAPGTSKPTPGMGANDTPDAPDGDSKAPTDDPTGAAAGSAPPADHGSAVAISADDSLAVVVNRDAASISVLALQYDKEAVRSAQLVKELRLDEGSEPYQVAISPAGDAAYVVLKRDQKLIKIGSLATAPSVVASVAVGSEPTAVSLGAAGRYAYVANWNDGTVDQVETSSMRVTRTFDLNSALVKTGYLGDVQPRAALAHPRSIAVQVQGSADVLFVTEFFAQQIEAELSNGENSDTRKVGLVYRVDAADGAVRTLRLSALNQLGFLDENADETGCYPNQLQAIALNGNYAYVVSVCASPKGPLGVKVTTDACTTAADCQGLVEPACVTPFADAPNNVCVDVAGAKTTTAPVLSIIDTRDGHEVGGRGVSLNARFDALYGEQQTELGKQRFPLFANDVAFVPGTAVGYVSANGSDAVFRFKVDAKTGEIESVGGSTNLFIDLAPAGIAAAKAGKNPVGLAIAHTHKKVALVANDVSRNVSVLDFDTQAVAGGAPEPRVVQTASLPDAASLAGRVLRGKRFFNTGLARWSLRGQGWGACQSCHADGLTDNVTWYFARGPRQSTSLDGSFASTHPEDQRIFNWTAIFDEVADFEANTRGVSGGVGAIVSAVSVPPATADRIDFQGLGHAGLNGSSTQAADPANPLQLAAAPQLADWGDIEKYMQSIRSPRAPSNLDASKVAYGRELFTEQANCQGCHGGEKWTVSRRFYTPSTETNTALNSTPLVLAADFPTQLLPARQTENQTLRFAGGNAAAFDQILCALRPVGTFNVAEEGVGVAELRADMKTLAQGDGNPEGEGRGYNVPSLLSASIGAPYLHAGNARTLEALLGDTFAEHHSALAPNFLTETDPAERSQRIEALVQYLLSIDEHTAYPALPETGAAGGSLCPQTFPTTPDEPKYGGGYY